jgi:predicted nucleic acid-binding protein
MKKLRVYIDTSVIGGCFDPGFEVESNALFERAGKGDMTLVTSDLLVAEIKTAPQMVRDFYQSLPANVVEVVVADPEAEGLQAAYLAAGVVGPANEDDALHVAIATTARCDVIVSWNFRHIVHYDKIRGYNAVNIREGYPAIAIHSPKEVV